MSNLVQSIALGTCVGSLSGLLGLGSLYLAAAWSNKWFYSIWVLGILVRFACLFGVAWWLYGHHGYLPLPTLLSLCLFQTLFVATEVWLAYRQVFMRRAVVL